MKNFISFDDVECLDTLVSESLRRKKNPLLDKTKYVNKTIYLLFFNPSLRTRLSTYKAASNLGLNCHVMNIGKDGWQLEFENGTIMDGNSQEHIKEAAKVVSRYCNLIGIRTFPTLKDKKKDYSEVIIKKFLEYTTVPVISLESATLHPLQSLADIVTIEENKKIKKPKVVLTWAPHTKALPQAVPNSFAQWISKTDYDFVIANPKGFNLSKEFTKGVKITHNQKEAFEGADFIYAKNWSSFDNYGKVGKNLNDWIVDEEKMKLTNNAKFMHCLPIRRNLVATDGVLDSDNSLIIEQAENRVYSTQAVIDYILEDKKLI